MTTNHPHTPTPYRVIEDRLMPGKFFLAGPDHDGEGEPILAYSASEADGDGRQAGTFAFLVHAANHHEALRATVRDLIDLCEADGVQDDGALTAARRIHSESATQ